MAMRSLVVGIDGSETGYRAFATAVRRRCARAGLRPRLLGRPGARGSCLWVPRRPSAAATRTFRATVPGGRMPPHGALVPLRGIRTRGPARPPLVPSSGRPGDRNSHVAPRGSGPATPGRPTCSAASRPGTSRRAVTTRVAGPSRRVLCSASNPVALAPRPRATTLDVPTPPVRSTYSRGRRCRPRRPVGS